VTATSKQVEFAVRYRAAAVLAHGDYLLHLAEVAREMGYDPKTDFAFTALSTIGDTARLEETFGLPCYATYGFHEVAGVSVECPARQGLHTFEDAFVVEIVDVETGDPLPDGELGAICITELYKTGSPQFRYNIMDLSSLYPPGRCECGSWLRRMTPFAGRGDTMVKVRGVNVWPEAVGRVAMAVAGVESDYFVRAEQRDGIDELIVTVVSTADPVPIAAAVADRLRDHFGVRIQVDVARPGELDELTEIRTSPKAKRFQDLRPRRG
jgi:phenylacetate-CoA ligase